MENLIVTVIVVLAVVYVGKTFYKSAKNSNKCACGCSSCDTSSSCTLPDKTNKNIFEES